MLGVNDRVQLAEVTALAQRRILEDHMRAGVTIVDPASTCIDAGVTIGPDTTIEPGTTRKGATASANGCSQCSYVDARRSHDGVTVGPFAYLRPGTRLRDGAKAGTFVEIKNSDIGEGTKVPHLSYIGDADVGPDTNLGAATITANYNGKTKAKNRTTIGAGVKTAVDTTLVAPVSLGDGADTAAGSVVTQTCRPARSRSHAPASATSRATLTASNRRTGPWAPASSCRSSVGPGDHDGAST